MPFVVYALPRSRTYCLSKFLTYGGWVCAHEQMRYLRGMEDVRSCLSQDYTGTAETLAARWWRVLQHWRPDIRVVVIRRPVEEVVESLMRGCGFDAVRLTQQMRKLDRALVRIEDGAPRAISVNCRDLADEDGCAHIFEHCLPFEHDHDWWATMAPINARANMPALMLYIAAHRPQLDRAARACRRQMYSLLLRTASRRLRRGMADASSNWSLTHGISQRFNERGVNSNVRVGVGQQLCAER